MFLNFYLKNAGFQMELSMGKLFLKTYIVPFVTVICLTYAFWVPLLSLFDEWGREEYSHGYLLPAIALLMAWHRLANRPIQAKPSWAGLIWLFAGIALLVISELSTFRQLSYYGILTSIVGLSLTYLGRDVTKTLSPAFFLLLFALPLPTFVFNNLSLYLQLISSSLGVFILEKLGIPVFQDGNVIDLGIYKLQVVEACSGLRYLFPLASFSFLVAYLLKDRWWKRLVIFFSAAPLAIGMNSIRIALAGILTNLWGPKTTEGFMHMFEGFVIFMMCVGVLMLEAGALRKIGSKGVFMWEFFAPPKGRLLLRPVFNSGIAIAVLALSIFTALLVGSGWTTNQPQSGLAQTNLSQFPLTIEKWHGQRGEIGSDILDALALTDYWIADYTRAEETAPVNFYIAYYANQQLLSAIHSPSTCLPGGGWKIESAADRQLPITIKDGSSLRISRLLVKRGDAKQIIYYWFDERGRDITNQYGAKWFLLVDSIAMHRSDGALVRLVTSVSNKETEADADRRLSNFLTLAYPFVRANIPAVP
jgi:exosortase D (VPLPA-CTERM-specific)